MRHAMHSTKKSTMKDKDFEINAERYAEHLDRGWHKILTELEWQSLRDKFFLECVGEIEGRIVVDMSPHNVFEWFKKRLCGVEFKKKTN